MLLGLENFSQFLVFHCLAWDAWRRIETHCSLADFRPLQGLQLPTRLIPSAPQRPRSPGWFLSSRLEQLPRGTQRWPRRLMEMHDLRAHTDAARHAVVLMSGRCWLHGLHLHVPARDLWDTKTGNKNERTGVPRRTLRPQTQGRRRRSCQRSHPRLML